MKNLDEMTEPDIRSTAFGGPDPVDGTSRATKLPDFHAHAGAIQLNQSIPENVRSYMEAVKTLFAYGWFYYPFFTLSAFMATTAVEMALRTKFPKKGKDHRGLGKLLNRVLSEGLLLDESFPSREHVRAAREMMYAAMGDSGPQHSPASTEDSYAKEVTEKLTHFRNVFAHPHDHWILFPGQALDLLVLAGEVINQLWPGKSRK